MARKRGQGSKAEGEGGTTALATAALPVERLTDGRFAPGKSANPAGRPRGIREAMPRGFVKRVVWAVMEGNLPAHMNALRQVAISPKTALAFSDHAAKLNKELGHGQEAGGGNTVINVTTNVNVLSLKAAGVRAVQPALPGPKGQA
ncbi:MAG TPA: DUF5681 domain-containing protein [Terriglobales bacterium]|nr:DUF5681 domain-containing protein [Terriglobales bacterium]